MICIDELGPLSAKTYPGEAYVPGPQRATVEPDYGRRGTCWVHGAFEPATGEATVIITERRDSASHLQLLEQMVDRFPAERWLVIEDNLSTHASRDVQRALLSWPELQVQFLPKYASWMNLIEPWWKQLKNLALKGRRFETTDDLEKAVGQALVYWSDHRRPYRWRKIPDMLPAPPLGGFGSEMIPYTS